ncbi:MAG TPA: AgmX/PglI C-terminal domain-containing protein [Nannocystis sp.]|jgi:outer membrane biosynthesis protein TonB
MKNTIIHTLLGFVALTCTTPASAAEGQLDKDQISGVVKAHISEIRACYNQALSKDPQASGKIVIDFTIGDKGTVTKTAVAESSMKDAAVPTCMSAAIEGWLFPKPDGGSVEVTYPFVLEPG